MKDTIYRQEAINAMDCVTDSICAQQAIDALISLPSADTERKTGQWIEITSSNHTYKCSVCGRLLVNITDGKNNVAKNYPYCHCGAKMNKILT